MHDWTRSVHHVLEEVHEFCDRVGMGIQVHVLAEPIERLLSVEFYEGEWVLWASAGRCAGGGVGWWREIVWRIDVVWCRVLRIDDAWA